MRVAQLEMQNFRCFTDKKIETPAPRALFLGDHGKGKSTMFDALRWLMTGRCRGLDKNGHGVEDALLRLGCESKTIAVSGNISHQGKDYTLTRTWANGQGQFRVAGWGGSSLSQQQEWLDTLGVDMDVLSALLDSETFFSLDRAEAKNLVLTCMKVSVELPDGTFIDLEELEKRYERAFAARRDANRDLKQCQLPIEPTEKAGDVLAIEARLAELATQRETLMQQKANEQGQGVVYLQQFNALQAELERCRAAILIHPDPQAQIETLDIKATETQTELDGIVFKLDTLPMGMEFESMLAKADALANHKPTAGCVLSANVKCPAKQVVFKDEARELRKTAETLKATHLERAGLILSKSGLTGLIDTLHNERRGLLVKQQIHTELVADEQRLMANMDELAGKIPDEASPDTSAIDKQIEDVNARIVKGTGILAKYKAIKASWERYASDKTRYELANAAVDVAAEAVKLYGPDGIRVPALAKVIPAFEASVNMALKPFGYELAVTPDPWDLRINGLRYVTLSASEKLRVGIALQIALAQTTGVNFTLIDQLDMLLTAPRTVLTKLIMSPDVHLDQVWLARAYEPSAGEPTIAGTTVVRL